MDLERSLLANYQSILEEKGTAQYLICKQIPVSFKLSESTERLWHIHDDAVQHKKIQNMPSKQSLLDLKIEIAERLYQECCFCEHRCRVNRTTTPGRCGVQEPRIAFEFLHFGEEEPLVPSYTIFFSGCTFHCVFCQNSDISQKQCGTVVQETTMVKAIEQRIKQGARNVNWVGGDPTSNLLFILKVLQQLDTNISQVWNSNMYCSEETMKLLNGVMDIYLTDFKYGNDSCAKRLSDAEGYVGIVKRNHILAYHQGEVIVRHLVLPGHINCCSKPIIKHIAENLPDALVNIMAQYRPEYRAYEYNEIARAVSKEEVLQVKKYADKQGIHEI